MKKIALFLGIVITVLSVITVLFFMFGGGLSVPEIQDFPGLQQELDNLEVSSDLNVDFDGDTDNKVRITGYVPRGADVTAHCKLLTDSVTRYISEDYILLVKVISPSENMFQPGGKTHTCRW